MKSNHRQKSPKPQTFELHPHSIKYLNAGHVWVTKDRFTELFPNELCLIGGGKEKDSPKWIFINDPHHPQVKARRWSEFSNSKIKQSNFWFVFEERLSKAVNFRNVQKLHEERENFYLCFGEADEIPGLFIQKLGEVILIQSYCNYWKYFEKIVLNIVKRVLQHKYPMEPLQYYFQSRNKNQKIQLDHFNYKNEIEYKTPQKDFKVKEYGIHYHCSLGRSYDVGVYTDMSYIRKKVGELINENTNVLNLYSYTGAYSLYALKKGAPEVHSVDLSEKYLSILDQNIKVNELDETKHKTINADVLSAVNDYTKTNKTFDLIICDPPSASSDGKKVTSALKNYEELLPKLVKITSTDGHLAIFLNTHTVNWNKFEKAIMPIAEKLKLTKMRRFNLGEDCKSLKGFQEGDYLKGILFKRK